MAWLTPKTDWEVRYDAYGEYDGDWFGYPAYMRIRENIMYIADQGSSLFGAFSILLIRRG